MRFHGLLAGWTRGEKCNANLKIEDLFLKDISTIKLMVKWIILYSSATGNTRKLAEAAASAIGADLLDVSDVLGFAPDLSHDGSSVPCDLLEGESVENEDEVLIDINRKSLSISVDAWVGEVASRLSKYDGVMVGYWLRRGAPDQRTAALLPKISGKRVALFQTHGAYAGSDHAVTAFARAGALLGPDNLILGTFSCQAAVNPALIKRRLEGKVPGHQGEDLEACKKRWADAANHPDENDLERMRVFARRMQALAENVK